MSNQKKEDNEIGFVLKSMLDRDPHKRRVKPNQKNYALLNLQIMDDSSSDDEDYVPTGEDETAEGNALKMADSDQEDKQETSDVSSEDDDDEDGDDDDDDEDEEEDEEEENSDSEDEETEKSNSNLNDDDQDASDNKVERIKSKQPAIKCTIKRESNNSDNFSIVRSGSKSASLCNGKSKKLTIKDKWRKIMICSVCLGDQSNENDEIVECDCCSITVHEACYGLVNADESEIISLDSNASSASTEPWFCDACQGGQNNNELTCELCPQLGGIFKQTETGRWVHLVCALYINDVAFSNTLTLSGITLFEMNYERWGARMCSLCDDERFARTGVCIACDAGMCRTYFHVSCAQKHGLLCEPQIHDDHGEIVDPFFAHCKQHAVEKHVVKSKRRNYLALQSRMKQVRSDNQPMNDRIRSKLTELRQQYVQSCQKNVAQHPIPHRAPRPLTSSHSVMQSMINKAELMGLSSKGQVIYPDELLDVRKKWHIPPAFSVEFVGYYLDREPRFLELNEKYENLKKENENLCEQESVLRHKYEQTQEKMITVKHGQNDAEKEASDLMTAISCLTDQSPDTFKLFKSDLTTDKSKSKATSGLSSKSNGINACNRSKANSVLLLKRCGICQKCTDQHTMALCDNCDLHYHFTCLDPPLTRMPRKTKFGGWQCSECTSKEEEQTEEQEMESSSLPNENGAKRRLRENVRCPTKYIPDTDFNVAAMEKSKMRKRKQKKQKANERANASLLSNNSDGNLQPEKKARSSSPNFGADSDELSSLNLSNRSMVTIKKEFECCVCKESSSEKCLVRCDRCEQHYHFGCLNPPCSKNPRHRGYEWFCEHCESDDSDNEDQEDSENKHNFGNLDLNIKIKIQTPIKPDSDFK